MSFIYIRSKDWRLKMPKKTFFNLPSEKKEKIIEAVYDLFIENDYEDVNIRRITNKVDISIGSFYQYFQDKDNLYLYLLSEIEKKIYAQQKEISGQFLMYDNLVAIENICTPKEIKFNRTWYNVPVEVMMKFYFGKYSKEMNSIVWDELVELEKDGKIKSDLEIDFIFHIYVTSMFNILMYFRDNNITDENKKLEIKNKFYRKWFINSILDGNNIY